ncbi:hypothetical protein Tco_0754636 [Tanacetum coccineum]
MCRIAFLQGYEPLEDIYEDEEDVFYLKTKEIIITSSSEEENSDVRTFVNYFGNLSVQWIDRIVFHLNDELIIIKKVTKAFSQGQPKFLESMKKDSKIKQIPGTNISQENIKGCNIFLQINKYKIIEEILDKVCSENPIDPQKTKGWMKASIKLIDPNTVVRVKTYVNSPQDRIEFTKQINELLDMKLIIQSKSPHMSPAFLVENEAEKRRGKKRMVVNYKKINRATIGDSHISLISKNF